MSKDEQSRKETTATLTRLLRNYIAPRRDPRIYWAREVTFDYGTQNQIRVDFMKFEPVNNTVSGIEKGDFYCYEIKSCVADFKSKNGHNFIGDYNYYVMTQETYDLVQNLLPYRVGVLVADNDHQYLTVVKKAKRMNRTRPIHEMLLMMFRSAARDRMIDISHG